MRNSFSRLSQTGSRKKPKRLVRWVKRLFIVAAFAGAGGVLAIASVFYYYSLSLPAIGPLLEGYHPPQTTRIFTADGVVIGEMFEERRTLVPIGKIPKVMMDAVIAAEDADFRNHKGLDYMGIARAVVRNIKGGRIRQGGSTITQQVARTFFLSRKKAFSRKIKEALLTKKIEERLTKDEILYLYLNQINFGHARYGIFEACRFYFNKPIEQITIAEAATLAGIPKGPSIYSPIINPERAKKRRAYVIGEMMRHGLITPVEARAALDAPMTTDHRGRTNETLAPEAVGLAIQAAKQFINYDTLKTGGYNIYTTIDSKMQHRARQAVIEGLTEIDTRHKRIAPYTPRKRQANTTGPLHEGRIYVADVTGVDPLKNRILLKLGGRTAYFNLDKATRYNPRGLSATEFAAPGAKLRVSLDTSPKLPDPLRVSLQMGPQSALVGLRVQDGAIISLVGGDRVIRGGFDRATQAKRQPGSVFKPFTYLAAIRTGQYTAATLLDDAPEIHGEWKPQNAHQEQYSGAIRMREALAKSLNLPAVKLITQIGPQNVVSLAQQLGVASDLEPTPSLTLGASAVSPLEMAVAYGTFARKGVRQGPKIIDRIISSTGALIPVISKPSEQVISEQEAYLITSLLESVVKGGTGAKAQALKRPVAGKTGTSNDQRDAWFVGYTPDIVCAVWVGFDDFKSVGRKEYGGRAALPIWLSFMKAAHETMPTKPFAVPTGIITKQIDPATGHLAYEGMEGAVSEIFIEGTEPTQTVVPPDLVSPEGFLMDQLTGQAPIQDTNPAPEAKTGFE